MAYLIQEPWRSKFPLKSQGELAAASRATLGIETSGCRITGGCCEAPGTIAPVLEHPVSDAVTVIAVMTRAHSEFIQLNDL
jgi:hypothetical protein